MDELQMVRELFEERPPPSPEVIAAARARLPLDVPVRRRMSLRVGLPAAVVAATAAVITTIVMSGSGIPGPVARQQIYYLPAGARTAAVGTAAAGRQELLIAARTVGQATAPPAGHGRFWLAKTNIGNFMQVGSRDNRYVILERVAVQDWESAQSRKIGSPYFAQDLGVQFASARDQMAWRRDGSPVRWKIGNDYSIADPQGSLTVTGGGGPVALAPGKPVMALVNFGPQQFEIGRKFLSAGQLRALPADPARLKALILTGFSNPGYQSREDYLFENTPALLTLPVTPAVRSALYQMLARLPGVRSLDHVQDVAGQRGIAVALTGHYSGCGRESVLHGNGGIDDSHSVFTSCEVQQRLIISPRTGMPLAQELRYVRLPAGQTWPSPNGLFSYRLFTSAGWTSQSPPANAGVEG